MKEYEFHEAASVIPQMGESERGALKEDIRKNGVHNPILLHEGKILDGCTRYLICKELGIEPVFLEWDGKGDPVEFVLSTNLHRRHLTESGRAMIGARLMAHFENAAKERQGTRTDISANLRGSENRKSSEDAARVVNVSPRSVESAKKVLTQGIPALVNQVDLGIIRLGQASKIAALAKEEQEHVLSLPKGERATELTKQNGRKSPISKADSRVTRNSIDITGQWKTALDLMLMIIEKGRADGWSDLSLEVVSEGLERLHAAARVEPAGPPDAQASADDYAGTDPGRTPGTIADSETVVTTEIDPPPGEVELAGEVAAKDASMENQGLDTAEQHSPVEEEDLLPPAAVTADDEDEGVETIPECETAVKSVVEPPGEIDLAGGVATDDMSEETQGDDPDGQHRSVEDMEGRMDELPSCYGKMFKQPFGWCDGRKCDKSLDCSYATTGAERGAA
jgi:ParB-like chromosome segregation protein Spo0J